MCIESLSLDIHGKQNKRGGERLFLFVVGLGSNASYSSQCHGNHGFIIK